LPILLIPFAVPQTPFYVIIIYNSGIRDHIIAKSMCVCGATHVLADDLLPNKTLRDTINRILESGNSSAENAGSMCQVQDMESVRCPPPKALSPTTSAASGGEKKPAPSNNNETSTLKPSIEIAEITSAWASAEIVKVEKPVDASANIQGSSNGKEAAVSQLNTQPPKEEMPQQVASGEQGKRKKKKPRMSGTDLAGPDYMMPMGPGPGNQYFNGFQPGFNGVQHGFNGVQPGFNGFHHGFNGFPGPFPGAMPPFVGYGFGGVIHPDPFAAQGFGFPNIPPPYRDLAEMGNRMNLQHPIMGREEFEAKKTEMKRKRENEIRRSEGGNVVRDSEKSRIMNNSAVTSSPVKPKSVCIILLSQFSLALSLSLSANWFGLQEMTFSQHPLSLFLFLYFSLSAYPFTLKRKGLIPQLLNRRLLYS
jgi:E3 ubiquitin-protein ligase RBBP6